MLRQMTNRIRLQIEVDPELLETILDFQFRHRMPNRSAAVRELLIRGIKAIAADNGANRQTQ